MSLRDATANSINTVYAQLALDIGPESFDEMARKLGITSELGGYYAEAIGGTESCCTVLEMAGAYASIADGGVHHPPTAIDRVVLPNGDTDRSRESDGERVISDGVAYTVADVMRGTLDYGTAAGNDISCPAAGKTGTTEQQSDAWFVGYTPEVATAVWTGNPDERVALPGYGADLSAPIWQQYMQAVIEAGGKLGRCDEFPEPEDPADLSPFDGGRATAGAGAETPDGLITPPEDGVDLDGDGYPDSAYAPGVGDQPSGPGR